eukprot:7224742-Pyramimonas_sp.AAC.1
MCRSQHVPLRFPFGGPGRRSKGLCVRTRLKRPVSRLYPALQTVQVLALRIQGRSMQVQPNAPLVWLNGTRAVTRHTLDALGMFGPLMKSARGILSSATISLIRAG